MRKNKITYNPVYIICNLCHKDFLINDKDIQFINICDECKNKEEVILSSYSKYL